MKTLLHVDMDAFFASVELLDHPEWKGRPVIVGAGPHERGVVSTCSYEARAFGVHSAMPSRTAYSLCPHAVFVRPRMHRYCEISERAFAVFERYSPFVEGVSIDEAFLDITGTAHLFGGPRELGEALRADVRRECGVTCSVGIAPNRLLAKIGSEEHKPDGLTMMPFEPAAIAAFLAPRPVGVLWGVGKRTVAELKDYGLETCGDLQRTANPRFADLRRAAMGVADDTVHWQEAEEKSVSREHTFDVDVYERAPVRAKLLELVAEVGMRFRASERWARTARLKIRDVAFNTYTRQMPFERPSRDELSFRHAALTLFDREFPSSSIPAGIRLIGFGVTNIQSAPDDGELLLFADPADQQREKRERLSLALDTLRARGCKM